MQEQRLIQMPSPRQRQQRDALPDVLEAKTADEANAIDKTIYRFEHFSESRQVYIFIKRSRV